MTLDDVRGRATITVPEAGVLLGIGRDAAYAAARSGDLPTLRLGRRVVVPVPRLLAWLGEDPAPRDDDEDGGLRAVDDSREALAG